MMNVSIIGSGNMAWFLAKKLQSAGHHLQGHYARNPISSNAFSAAFNCQNYAQLSDIPDLENHICFVAVSDSAIPEIAAQLNFQQTLIAHCSGASSIKLLEQSARKFGAFWCIYSISKKTEQLFEDLPIAIEGNNIESQKALFELAKSISSKAFACQEEQRLHLHLAAVFANNFSNHMMAIAEEICAAEKIPFEYLKPILVQSFSRLQNESPKEAQTGPARRKDLETIQKHLRLLADEKSRKALYQSISDSITKMYASIEG